MIVPQDGLLLFLPATNLFKRPRIIPPFVVIRNRAMNSRHADPLDGFYRQRLQLLEAMARGGNAIAVPAALDYCAKNGVDSPTWLVEAAAETTKELFSK